MFPWFYPWISFLSLSPPPLPTGTKVEVIAPPTQMPVDIALVKANCRVQHNLEDTLFQHWIGAATALAQILAGDLQLVTAGYRLTSAGFPPARPLNLIVAPVSAVSLVQYFDGTGTQQTWDPSNYQLSNRPLKAEIWPAPNITWPATQPLRVDAITVEFTAGADPQSINPLIKQAIILAVTDWFQNRTDSAQRLDMPMASQRLLQAAGREVYV